MARYRVSRPAERDLATILAASAARWGESGRRRYAALIARAMRTAADDPFGVVTRDRRDLGPGIRSLHLRHARGDDPKAKVQRPVHLLYYRPTEDLAIEIVRVLHERMDPARHLTG